MPRHNRFEHQRYEEHPGTDRFRFLHPPTPTEPDTDAWDEQLAAAGKKLREAKIRTIYLVHGTFAGTDVSGIYREIHRVAPGLSDSLSDFQKQLIDRLAQDMANYTEDFAKQFADGINAISAPAIEVRRFFWSSENHHAGRAIAALQLLVELCQEADRSGPLVLWGHSHAGNVLAILSNLLAGTRADRKRFLAAFGTWLARRDPELWEASERLLSSSEPLLQSPVDMVTFGTPLRYGWDSNGYRKLVHFVNHHAMIDPAHRVPFPPTAEQLRQSEAGDYFQQLFIAGTNFPPGIWAWGQWKVERQLGQLLQAGVPSQEIVQALSHGRRVAADGQTLLVDYNAVDEEARTLTGHAVYTRLKWLPFHATTVANELSAS